MFLHSDESTSGVSAAPAAVPRLAASGNTASNRVQLAYALVNDGQYDAALNELKVALDDNPELAEGHLVQGLALVRQGRHRAAIGPFCRAMEFGEQPRLATFALAAVYLRLDDFMRAADLADGLIAQDLADAQAHALRGEALGRLSRTDEAIVSYRAAAQLDPANAGVRLRLGELLAERGVLEEAERELLAAVELMPTDPRALLALARLLRRLGHSGRAIEICRRAIPCTAPKSELYQILAECCLEERMFFDAMVALRIAMVLDPQNAACQRMMGQVMAQQGRTAESRQYEAAADKLGPPPTAPGSSPASTSTTPSSST